MEKQKFVCAKINTFKKMRYLNFANVKGVSLLINIFPKNEIFFAVYKL